MSNYNQTLQSNNIDLQSILNTINELPEAGGVQATPVISVNTSGLITATAGTKSSTHQLAFQPAKTITPSTASQIAVSSGYYTGGNITVAAVPTQTKSVTPTTSTQSVAPDSGKFLSKVTVNAIPSTYVKPTSTKAATTYTPSTTNQTIASGTYLAGTQTIKGDANLVAGNIKSGVSIFGVSGTLVEGSGGGSDNGYDEADSLITMTMCSYANDRVTSIGQGAFAYASKLQSVTFSNVLSIGRSAFCNCDNLTTVSFPACTTIGFDAFYYCKNLTSVNFPACTAINGGAGLGGAFYYCDNLTSVNFPVCTTIGSGAFYYCDNLTSVNFPVCTTIGSCAFYNCDNLTSVNFPVCTTIGSEAFYYCDNLTTVSFPACTTIGSEAFYYCDNLTTVSFPACTTIGGEAFYYCDNLTTVSFPACTTIGSSAFRKCYNLKSLYLTGSSLCKLSASNAFTSTPIGGYSASAGTYGSIYVPASLLTSYKTATNWTYFSSRFVGI